MTKHIFTLLTLLLISTLSLIASETVTLEEALQRAEQNNLTLASTSIDVAAAQRDIDTSWNLFLPAVSMSLSTSGMTPVFQAAQTATLGGPVSIPASSQGLNIGLSASFQLNPAVKDQFDSYDLSYRVQQVTYQQAKAEVDKSVTQLFYFLLMQGKNIELQEANIALASQRYEETQKKYESGFASETEVLSAQLSWEQLKPALQQAKNQYESSLLALKALIGAELNSKLEVEGEIPSTIRRIEVTDIPGYLRSTYGVQLFDLNTRQLEISKELSRKQAYFPTLSVTGSYGLSLWSDSFSNTASDSFSYQVALAIPLDGHIPNSRTDVSMQKIDESLRKLALQRQQTIDQMEMQVEGQVQNINMLSLQMDLAQRSLELTEQLYQMQSTQYETGYISFIDLEEASNNRLAANQNILALQYQYINALIELASTLNIEMKELI